MENKKLSPVMADLLLVVTAMIWGSAFVTVKNALDIFPPALLVAVRYFCSMVLTAVIFHRHLTKITKQDIFGGAVTGFLLGMAYLVQTIGLVETTAGKNAFLTAIYVMLVPFGCRLLFDERLKKRHYISAALMLAGIGMLSLSGGENGSLNRGDLLSIGCAVFFAAHMIAIPRFQKHTDMYLLIVLQFAFCALTAFLWHLLFEQHSAVSLAGDGIWEIFYLVVFSTTLGMSLQNIGESMTKASHAALLLSLESVFGVIFSCIFLHEQLTGTMIIGFAVIFSAIVISVR